MHLNLRVVTLECMKNQRTTSSLQRCYAKSPTVQDVFQPIPCRPHQLDLGDWEMGTAIYTYMSCTECSQVAGLIRKFVDTPRKHRLFVQLSFVQRSFVAVVIVDRHVYFKLARAVMIKRALYIVWTLVNL